MKLKEGEVICPKCKGRKLVPETNEKGYIVRQWSCDRCSGTGVLDWIEMVTGKREDWSIPEEGWMWKTDNKGNI